MRLLIKLLILSQFFYFYSLFSEEKEKSGFASNSVKWEKLDKNNQLKIIWRSYEQDKDFFEKLESTTNAHKKREEGIQKIEEIFTNKSMGKQKLVQIQPFLPLNNFLDSGNLDSSVFWKSSFDGGDPGGSGNQNIGIRFDYGISDDSLLSIYLAETDDPLYNYIKGVKTPNNWSSVALTYKKKIFESDNLRNSLSISSSIEYWKVHSGTGRVKSIFNETDNVPSSDKYEKIVYYFSIPFSKKFNNKTILTIAPGATFLPGKLGDKNIGKNFYGNNYFLATGINYDLADNLHLIGSYTFVLGPGNNSFDENLKFKKKPIYSYGFLWDVNQIIGIEGKITNGFGNTPSTGILTIPSDDKPLYYLGGIFRPSREDSKLFPNKRNDESLLLGGLTVNNALIPARGNSQLGLDYGESGSVSGFYGYSLSNIFQIQLIAGSFNDVHLPKNNHLKLRKTYLDDRNYYYRFGGKLLILSPQKFDPFWMSLRASVGRNEGDNHQGYMFTELINTFRINDRLHLNVIPKYFFSGVKSFGGIGISTNIRLFEKLYFIPELNSSFRDEKDINSSLVLRYLYSQRKSIDIYYSNATGTQDVGQLLENNDYKFGVKLNFLF